MRRMAVCLVLVVGCGQDDVSVLKAGTEAVVLSPGNGVACAMGKGEQGDVAVSVGARVLVVLDEEGDRARTVPVFVKAADLRLQVGPVQNGDQMVILRREQLRPAR